MTRWHLRSHRKPTGGLLNRSRKKRKHERGSKFLETRVGEEKKKAVKTLGGNTKIKLLSVESVNVAHKGKIRKAKASSVVENPANPHYVRRNVITKGAIVKTDIGNVRITSRPGHDGVINGILVEEKK
jgi:small subunit ribosomal protein S8e